MNNFTPSNPYTEKIPGGTLESVQLVNPFVPGIAWPNVTGSITWPNVTGGNTIQPGTESGNILWKLFR